ncbi:MAG: tetratricopeptide repeat protein [Phycisphaerales bacterium]
MNASNATDLSATRRRVHELGRGGEFRAAADAADRGLKQWPNDAELHLLRALASERLGEWANVVRHGAEFERLAPERDPMDISIGWALVQLGDVAAALPRLERAAQRHPGNATAWMNLGIAVKHLGDLDRARDCQRRAGECDASLPQPWMNLASIEQDCGSPERAIEALDALHARFGPLPQAESLRAFLTLCRPTGSPTADRAIAERAAVAIEATVRDIAPPQFRNERKRGKRLRVGFFSGDFRDHSVASFALPLVESLDRASIEPILFSSASAPDAVTARFARTAPLVDVRGLTPKALVENARGKRLDVAIDLSGHSAGNSLAAFAARIAPVQTTWLGYAGTTGIRTMDARFVDWRTDPIGCERACTERLVRLDPCFLCWRSREDVPLPPERSESDEPLTFGSFNDLSKLSDATLDAWARILMASPDARLVLKNYGLRYRAARDVLVARFATRGVAAERIEMIAWTATSAEHLALYGRVDVALDSFPYNGTTTTCEALWMGTPVVVLEGGTHHARVGASLLRAIGRDDLVAPTIDVYVERAIAAGSEQLRRAAGRRAAMRAAVARSPLRDEQGFARRFEAALRAAWHAYCDTTTTPRR